MSKHYYEPPLFGDSCAVCGLGLAHPGHLNTQTHNARAGDPDTSHAAARSVRLRSGTQKARLLLAYLHHGLLTDADAGRIVGLREAHKRCADLRNDGLVQRTDTVRDEDTGEQVMRCGLTQEGIEVARHLDRGVRCVAL